MFDNNRQCTDVFPEMFIGVVPFVERIESNAKADVAGNGVLQAISKGLKSELFRHVQTKAQQTLRGQIAVPVIHFDDVDRIAREGDAAAGQEGGGKVAETCTLPRIKNRKVYSIAYHAAVEGLGNTFERLAPQRAVQETLVLLYRQVQSLVYRIEEIRTRNADG